MLRTLLIGLLIYCTTLTATAQTVGAPAAVLPTDAIDLRTASGWRANVTFPTKGRIIHVVTLSRSGERQKCKVIDLSADSLTCESTHQRPPTIYKSEDITALIDPPSHHDRNIMIIPLALMAGALVGSFFIPLAWSITLRILSGVFLCAYAAMGEGDSDDHNNDILLYQRPNTTLTVHLHA